MSLRHSGSAWATLLVVTLLGCGQSKTSHGNGPAGDRNQDLLADDLGAWVDGNGDGQPDAIDVNHDGKADGYGLDVDADGKLDGLALDTDCDGIYDSYDVTGDGQPDFETGSAAAPVSNPDCDYDPIRPPSGGGAGGGSSQGGAAGAGGSSKGGSGSGGSSAGGGSISSELGHGSYQGTGTSSDQFAESDIYRDGVGYKFIANGWGSGWKSHNISWNGTSFKVMSLNGSQGENFSPAGYPTMFCGLYSMKNSAGTCGLPAPISSLKSVKTGWRWAANGNNGQYNAAWDIWLGNGTSLSSYLMVWLRDPPGQQPAGAAALSGATIDGLPGSWTVWTGNVNGHPIVNYVRAEGADLPELEFDVLAVYRDAIKRNYNLPGSNLLAVAVGFEVWNGPITNLVTDDFYVDVK